MSTPTDTDKLRAALIEKLKFEVFEGNPWITLRSGDVNDIIAALSSAERMLDKP